MGSEMCIRDRTSSQPRSETWRHTRAQHFMSASNALNRASNAFSFHQGTECVQFGGRVQSGGCMRSCEPLSLTRRHGAGACDLDILDGAVDLVGGASVQRGGAHQCVLVVVVAGEGRVQEPAARGASCRGTVSIEWHR